MNVEPLTIRWNKEKPDIVLFEGGDEDIKPKAKDIGSGKGTPLNDQTQAVTEHPDDQGEEEEEEEEEEKTPKKEEKKVTFGDKKKL